MAWPPVADTKGSHRSCLASCLARFNLHSARKQLQLFKEADAGSDTSRSTSRRSTRSIQHKAVRIDLKDKGMGRVGIAQHMIGFHTGIACKGLAGLCNIYVAVLRKHSH